MLIYILLRENDLNYFITTNRFLMTDVTYTHVHSQTHTLAIVRNDCHDRIWSRLPCTCTSYLPTDVARYLDNTKYLIEAHVTGREGTPDTRQCVSCSISSSPIPTTYAHLLTPRDGNSDRDVGELSSRGRDWNFMQHHCLLQHAPRLTSCACISLQFHSFLPLLTASLISYRHFCYFYPILRAILLFRWHNDVINIHGI